MTTTMGRLFGDPLAERLELFGRFLQVDEAVLELLVSEGADSCGDPGNAAGTTGEPGGKSDQHASVMPTCGEPLGGNPSEVRDVLGEQHVPIHRSGGEDFGVGPSGQPPFSNGGSLDATGP